MGNKLKDNALIVTKALPASATSIYSDGIDLGHSVNGDFLANVEFKISAPACTTAELADGHTLTYFIQHDDDSAFGSAATVYPSLIVQTGASGAGDGAEDKTVRLPVDVKRYVRVGCTRSGSGDASTKSLTFEALL